MNLNSQLKLQILEQLLGQHTKPTSKGEIEFYCPFCHHHKMKLQINLDKEKFHCWVCNTKGSRLEYLFYKLQRKDLLPQLKPLLNKRIEEFKESPKEFIQLPSEFRPLYIPNQSSRYWQDAIKYALGRGLTFYDFLKYNIGYCSSGEYAGMLIIPSYDEHNSLNYFVGRSFYRGTIRYKNPSLPKNVVGFENLISYKYPLALVEGVFDAMAVKRNAIPLFGKLIQESLLRKIVEKKVTDIIICLDKDAIKEAYTAAEYFLDNGINVRMVELEDKDPSNAGFIHITEKIRTSKPIDVMEILKYRLNRA